MVRMQNN